MPHERQASTKPGLACDGWFPDGTACAIGPIATSRQRINFQAGPWVDPSAQLKARVCQRLNLWLKENLHGTDNLAMNLGDPNDARLYRVVDA